tara:strand:- start:303 stop:677 length:375 start_codon:yes stop_codon:yes gene_type:complete
MSISKLDHVYLSVKNLDRAIQFYESFLQMKTKHRFEDRWADFDDGKGFYLGLYNPSYDGQKYTTGNNVTIGFHTTNIEKEHARIKVLKPKTITDVMDVNFFMPYRFFQFEDTEGNVIEVAQYKK